MSFDAMILGAGAAGATAALALRKQGLSVCLIERDRLDRRVAPAPEWLSPAASVLLGGLDADGGDAIGEPFKGLMFHSADLVKSAASSAAASTGFRLDYARLVRRLNALAVEAGAERIEGQEPQRLDFGEQIATAHFGARDCVEARFVLLADGVRLPKESGGDAKATGRWVVCLQTRVDRKAADPDMHWVLGLDREPSPTLWWYDGGALVLMRTGSGTRTDVAAALKQIGQRIADRRLVPGGFTVRDGDLTIRPAPPLPALEIDSHVEKRCLRIGDAGGFVSAISGEGIYPAMWSARLAADNVVQAAGSRHPQDQLRQFSTLWRTTMADYLRPPNTDMHFLLPLIFSNQQMADRMASAFWTGSNI